jgi:hypothetical protein
MLAFKIHSYCLSIVISPATRALNEDYFVVEKCALTLSAFYLLQQKYVRTPVAYRFQHNYIWNKISLQAMFIPDYVWNFLFEKMAGLLVKNCK